MAELKEFLNGKEIWGVFYLLGKVRIIERLKLIKEMRTVYKCEYEIFKFSTETNKLLGHEKKIISIKKYKLGNLDIYGYTLEEAIQRSIEHQKQEVESLKSKISAMEEEIDNLSRYKEWFPNLRL